MVNSLVFFSLEDFVGAVCLGIKVCRFPIIPEYTRTDEFPTNFSYSYFYNAGPFNRISD